MKINNNNNDDDDDDNNSVINYNSDNEKAWSCYQLVQSRKRQNVQMWCCRSQLSTYTLHYVYFHFTDRSRLWISFCGSFFLFLFSSSIFRVNDFLLKSIFLLLILLFQWFQISLTSLHYDESIVHFVTSIRQHLLLFGCIELFFTFVLLRVWEHSKLQWQL